MTSEFGNMGWQIFVFLSYGIVGFSLIGYAFFSYLVRKNALVSLVEEGFLKDDFHEKNKV